MPLRFASAVLLLAACVTPSARAEETPLLASEFIYETAPFPQCHASTIAEAADGTLVAAWFGGTREKHPDVGIWVARRVEGKWTAPVEVANGVQSAELRHPCWNPVLAPYDGKLLLFFKVGPSPSTWWGEMLTSEDNGKTWAHRRKLPAGHAGPIKNKPLLLKGGVLLCGSSTEDEGWRVHFERMLDGGDTWSTNGPINDGREIGAIQPSLLVHEGGRLQALGRSRQGKLWTAWSKDPGETWSEMSLLDVPNPNAGTDAVTLADGRHLLVYNHTTRGRSPLNVAVSRDGTNWHPALVLEDEPGEYSYPAMIKTADSRLHTTYTCKRERVKHVVLDPARLTGPDSTESSPPRD